MPYAEIVASIASKSAGPGTRANIDEFTETTARGLESVGGADRAKAIIVLNPGRAAAHHARHGVRACDEADCEESRASVSKMVGAVQRYVPGFRLKQEVQFERLPRGEPLHIAGFGEFSGIKVSRIPRSRRCGHYLPTYAGNLDIMTSAALATGERIAGAAAESGYPRMTPWRALTSTSRT